MRKYSSYNYINGNYIVIVSPSGKLTKRAFRAGEELKAAFPDSIDLKISNRCKIGCPFCHESSIPGGKIFDFDKTIEILSQLPKEPIEIAIGGGDVLETPKETGRLICWLNEHGYKPRITINWNSIKDFPELQSITPVDALGISIQDLPELKKTSWDVEESLAATFDIESGNPSNRLTEEIKIVFHIIAGVFPPDKLEKLFETCSYDRTAILVLGYKRFGRGKHTGPSDEKILEFEQAVKQLIYKNRTRFLNNVIGFDNLALEQLHIKDSLTNFEWNSLYMGEEGRHSMYIDAVNGEFAKTSRSEDRVSWDSIGLLDYFKSL